MNLVIQHLGMGFPVGAIVPPSAFPNGYGGHLALGAVKETKAPCTHELDMPAPAKAGEAEAQNTQLRLRVVELEGQVAGLIAERDEARGKVAELSQSLAEHAELLEQATSAAADAEAESFNARNTSPLDLPPIA